MQLSDMKMHTTLHWLVFGRILQLSMSPELEVKWVKYPAFLIVLPTAIMHFSQPLKLYNVQLQLC